MWTVLQQKMQQLLKSCSSFELCWAFSSSSFSLNTDCWMRFLLNRCKLRGNGVEDSSRLVATTFSRPSFFWSEFEKTEEASP